MSFDKLSIIDPPDWATTFGAKYGDLSEDEIGTLAKLHADLLAKVTECIEEYVSDFDDVDNTDADDVFENYPNRFEMTGEFYISDERYDKEEDVISASICLELLGRPDAPSARDSENLDYHGLEVLAYVHLANESVEIDGVVSSWGS